MSFYTKTDCFTLNNRECLWDLCFNHPLKHGFCLYINVTIPIKNLFFIFFEYLYEEETTLKIKFFSNWMGDDFCPRISDDVMWWLFDFWYIKIYRGERCLSCRTNNYVKIVMKGKNKGENYSSSNTHIDVDFIHTSTIYKIADYRQCLVPMAL